MQTWRRFISLPVLVIAGVSGYYVADRMQWTPVCDQQAVGTRDIVIRRVVDGDTLVDWCGRHIRVIGIDTPELDTPQGPKAKAFTTKWLQPVTQPVQLRICADEPRDRYGRILARVSRGDRDLSRDLLHSGRAWVMAIAPCSNPYVNQDLATQQAAQHNANGLWEQATTATVAAAEAVGATHYVRVRDRLQDVRRDRAGLVARVGRDAELDIMIDRAAVPHLLDQVLQGLREPKTIWLSAEGKPWHPKSGPPRLYIDYGRMISATIEPR